MGCSRAQIAIEYIVITGVIFLMIIPTSYFLYYYSSNQAEQIRNKEIFDLGTKLATNAKTIYFQGNPSRIILESKMPTQINKIKTAESDKDYKDTIVFESEQEIIPFVTDVPIILSLSENYNVSGIKYFILDVRNFQENEKISEKVNIRILDSIDDLKQNANSCNSDDECWSGYCNNECQDAIIPIDLGIVNEFIALDGINEMSVSNNDGTYDGTTVVDGEIMLEIK